MNSQTSKPGNKDTRSRSVIYHLSPHHQSGHTTAAKASTILLQQVLATATHLSSPYQEVLHPKTLYPATPSASSRAISTSRTKCPLSTPRASPASTKPTVSTSGPASPPTMVPTLHPPLSRKRGVDCLLRLPRRFRPRHRKAREALGGRRCRYLTLRLAHRLCCRLVIAGLVLSMLDKGLRRRRRRRRELWREVRALFLCCLRMIRRLWGRCGWDGGVEAAGRRD